MGLTGILREAQKGRVEVRPSIGKIAEVARNENSEIDHATNRIIAQAKQDAHQRISREPIEIVQWQDCAHLKVTDETKHCGQFLCDCKENACPQKFRKAKQ